MLAQPIPMQPKTNNIVPFRVIDNSNNIDNSSVKYNKDGSIKKTRNNRVKGISSEVYAFRTKEEIKAMMDVFNKHINEAENEIQRKIACRNKLLFLIGINIGVRASDLRLLKWSFFIDKDGKMLDKYTIQPVKQRKYHKFITLHINDAIKIAIEKYINEYPIDDLDDYIFFSRKGNEPVCAASLWRIICDTASEAGIKQNIGSHSLRKTWGFWCWHEAKDKGEALVKLMQCFNHSSQATTLKYIGITDDEKKDMYNSVALGIEFI